MRDKLIELISKYFNIGDSCAYHLTRVKEAFAYGTVCVDDFVEFDEDTVNDLVDYLIQNGVSVDYISVEKMPISKADYDKAMDMAWDIVNEE